DAGASRNVDRARIHALRIDGDLVGVDGSGQHRIERFATVVGEVGDAFLICAKYAVVAGLDDFATQRPGVLSTRKSQVVRQLIQVLRSAKRDRVRLRVRQIARHINRETVGGWYGGRQVK